MRRFVVLVLMLVGAAMCSAQFSYPYIVTSASDPTGNACSAAQQLYAYKAGNILDMCGSGNVLIHVGNAGSVTSVALTGSGTLFSSTPGTPVTGSGNLNVDSQLQAQAANCIVAGPASGAAATPTCRTMVAADVPVAVIGSTPTWLTYLGNGADGSNTTASGNLNGEFYYTNFTVPFGNTVTVNATNGGLAIHATGTCTIAGSIVSSSGGSNGTVIFGASAGGSGGGAAAGTAAPSVFPFTSGTSLIGGGTAGASSGGNGGNGQQLTTSYQRMWLGGGLGIDGMWAGGAQGKQGGSSGGTGGLGGQPVILICAAITGTDGTHTGQINASGGAGNPPSANSTGAGSGGGGGMVVLSSQAIIVTQPTLSVTGGPGGLVTVPEAVSVGGTCTSPAKATLGVSGGALSGTCTVVQAGTGCGTGTGVTFSVLGGGGTLGTGTVNPTWSGGALASCTTTAGTSSGYTASTFTTAGTGGDGGLGFTAVFQGW